MRTAPLGIVPIGDARGVHAAYDLEHEITKALGQWRFGVAMPDRSAYKEYLLTESVPSLAVFYGRAAGFLSVASLEPITGRGSLVVGCDQQFVGTGFALLAAAAFACRIFDCGIVRSLEIKPEFLGATGLTSVIERLAGCERGVLRASDLVRTPSVLSRARRIPVLRSGEIQP